AATSVPTPVPSPLASPAPSATPAPGASPAPGATIAPGAASSPEVQVRIARLDVESGDLAIVDRTVQPFYRGKVTDLNVHATSLRAPEAPFDQVDVAAKLPGGAPLIVKARRDAKNVQLEGSIEGLQLPPFNPYVTQAAGYSIPRGTAKLTSTAWWGPAYYGA